MSATLDRTPLYDWHVAHRGKLVDFAGWAMPVQYTTIVEEHTAVRTAAGLFDVSHMGRFRFTGPGAGAFVDSLVTRRTDNMKPGAVRYALMCKASGGILDDVLVYRMETPEGVAFYDLVVNAGNREKLLGWIRNELASPTIPSVAAAAKQVDFSDRTTQTAMLAFQGPAAVEIAQSLTPLEISAMRYYTSAATTLAGFEALVSRTGYTGEDGIEAIVPAEAAVQVADALLAAGANRGAIPAGLGARDTLRLEAAMPLYGHELTEEINPIQADLDFAVNVEGREFIGGEALLQAMTDAAAPRRIGLSLPGKRVPREGYAILAGGEPIGAVTSGTFSPTLQMPIAMGYVKPEHGAEGTELAIDIRGREEPARVVALPFYSRKR